MYEAALNKHTDRKMHRSSAGNVFPRSANGSACEGHVERPLFAWAQ
ncbi:MAG: hypothetical protein OJF61_000808 [Rhodanobacteraceae bacterium]|nr:MAG: hypothetical protein OJF61_000808 [Rhodanobacteraceae bacterium]